MECIPVTKPYFDDSEYEEIKSVLESGWVAQGERAAEFEKMVAAHEGMGFGVAVTSCTSALQLAVRTLGISSGDDVIIPAFTFIATANAVVCEGASPVFTDIDPRTYNICIKSVEQIIERYTAKNGILINPDTGNVLKLIIPVHLFGLCADMPGINALAERYNINVLEDSACALGSKINQTHEGALSGMSCLSFHPRKSVTTGEGGMVLTNSENQAEYMRSLRSHGAKISEVQRHKNINSGFLLPEYEQHGYNFRMTDIQAALGIAQMRKLDYIINERRKKAEYYNQLLRGINRLRTPFEPAGYYHTYQSYVCLLDDDNKPANSELRDSVMQKLAEKGISARVGTHAVHNTGYYRNRYKLKPGDFPVSDMCEKQSVALPLFVNLSENQQEYIAETLKKILY